MYFCFPMNKIICFLIFLLFFENLFSQLYLYDTPSNIKGLVYWEEIIAETNPSVTVDPCKPNSYINERGIKTVGEIRYEYNDSEKVVYAESILTYDQNGLISQDSSVCYFYIYTYSPEKCKYKTKCQYAKPCGGIGEIGSIRPTLLKEIREFNPLNGLLTKHQKIYQQMATKEWKYGYYEDNSIKFISYSRNGKLLTKTVFLYTYY